MVRIASLWIGTAVWLLATTALAQPTTAEKCGAKKNFTSGRYSVCRQRAERNLLLTGDTARYADSLATCSIRYSMKWQAAEDRWTTACPTLGDESAIEAFITQHSTVVATALSGVGLPRCGDAAINVAGEQCDAGDLGGASCASLGYPGGTLACIDCRFDATSCTGPCATGSQPPPLRTGQTTCYDEPGTLISCAGTGQDGEFQYGATHNFIDNGDGTFTDNTTGLMWEKLSDDGSIHDWNGLYHWTASWTKITGLNTAAFAGHNDWRLPNVNELQTLANYAVDHPSAFPIANTACAPGCTVTTCSCTQGDAYWSSTTYSRTTSYAWFVSFVVGLLSAGDKSLNAYVRAVR